MAFIEPMAGLSFPTSGVALAKSELTSTPRTDAMACKRDAPTRFAPFRTSDLLKGDTEPAGQSALAHAERLAPHSDLGADMHVDRAGKFGLHNKFLHVEGLKSDNYQLILLKVDIQHNFHG